MMNLLDRLVRAHRQDDQGANADDQLGAGATEYASMASLIAMMIIGGVTTFGSAVNDIFANFPNIWP